MRRRSLLATLGVGLASVAGCSNTPSDGSTATPDDGPTATGTAPRGSADSFEFVGVDAPERVQLNATYRFHVTVRNTGDRRLTFTSPISVRSGDGQWQPISQPLEVEVPPGETATWDSPRAKQLFLGTYEFRLDALGARWTLEAVPRTLAFGARHRTPTNLSVNALGGKFESQFPPTDADSSESTATGTATSTPTPTPVAAPDGETWLVVPVRVRNYRRSAQQIPAADTFSLHVDDETYAPQSVESATSRYHSVSLGGRTIYQQPLVFAVPEGTTAAEVAVEWTQSYAQGDVTVRWRTNA
ncbi:MAG: hypothetical protein ABEJ78_02650 [Haloferacaceae archaeon]